MKSLVVDGYNAIFRIKSLSDLSDKDLMLARNEVTVLADNYRRKIGHRQELTLVKIENIFSSTEKKQPKSTKKAEEISKKSLDTKGEKNGS